MKVCLLCGVRFDSSEWECPACHTKPELIAGYPAFSPGLAETNEGFRASYFDELAKLEAGNFWFRARNRLIIWAVQRYFPRARNFLEIGCGTGFVLSGIEKSSPHLLLFASEIYSAGLACAAGRIRNAKFFQMDACAIPFENEFDIVGAFDVLEHVKKDELVLSQIHQAVSAGGGIIITVPQHPFLWSQLDEHACHVRRYVARELKVKVIQAGFQVIRTTSFVSLLLPFMMVSRFGKRKVHANIDAMAELKLAGVTNVVLEKVLDWERGLIRLGLNFPAGGSLLLIARKQ